MAVVLRHVVLWAISDDATEEQKNAMLQALRELPSKIPEIRSLVCGLDAGLSAGNLGFALNVDFGSAEDYHKYATHPEHTLVLANFIRPILKPGSRTAVQFFLPAAKSSV